MRPTEKKQIFQSVLRVFVSSCWLLVLAAFADAKPLGLKGKELFVPGQVLVRLKAGVPSTALSGIGKVTGKGKRDFLRLDLAPGWNVPKALEALGKDPSVVWAQPNYRYYPLACPTPADAYLTPPNGWPLIKVRAPAAWDLFPACPPGSSSVTVAILDTGVSRDHPDLEGASFALGYNAITDTLESSVPNAATDDYGHGTFIAGILAAQWTSSNGENCPPGLNTTGMAGVAPGITLMRVKVLDPFNGGTTQEVVAGMDYAVAQDAKVLNLSLGSEPIFGLPPLEREALDNALAQGCVVVAAAGNESAGLNFPAAYPPVLAVGATDNNDQPTYYSNFGPGLDLMAPGGGGDGPYANDIACSPYVRPLFAPSIDILGAVMQCPLSNPCDFAKDPADNNFGSGAGTSYAAPFVSAAAALVMSMYTTLSGPQVVERLVNNADSLNGGRGWDPDTGYGRLNIYRALLPAATATPEITQYLKTFNSPNPFVPEREPSTNITLAIDQPSEVELTIHDGLGEVVRRATFQASQLNDNTANPQFKSYYVTWDGRNGAGQLVKTGVYFYTVRTSEGTGRNKIILVRRER